MSNTNHQICDQCEGEDDFHSENCPILKKLMDEWMMVND